MRGLKTPALFGVVAIVIACAGDRDDAGFLPSGDGTDPEQATSSPPDEPVTEAGRHGESGEVPSGAPTADPDGLEPPRSLEPDRMPGAGAPEVDGLGAEPPPLPVCQSGALRCEGHLVAGCNAARSGFELVRDCRSASRCAQEVERCTAASCSAETQACGLPALVAASSGVHAVTASDQYTCAIVNAGKVRCWGRNHKGQLGYGHTNSIGDDEAPARAGDLELDEAVVQLALGLGHSCALSASGAVRCWGDAAAGRLGWGDTGRYEYDAEQQGRTVDVGDDETVRAAALVPLGGAAMQLAAGRGFTCALLEGGAVRCWGQSYNGKLGVPAFAAESVGDNETPAQLAPVDLGGPAAFIAAGANHVCAILRTGDVRCWGYGYQGRLGYGSPVDVGDDETPAQAGSVALGARAISLAAGLDHTCALLEDGKLRCWGDGLSRQLGYDDAADVGDDELPTARPALDLGAKVIQLALGEKHTCALLESGGVRCWGGNSDGELGESVRSFGLFSRGTNEVPLGGPALSISARGSYTCAVLATHELVCWGSGLNGNLGYGNTEDVGDDESPASVGVVPVLVEPPPPAVPEPPPAPSVPAPPVQNAPPSAEPPSAEASAAASPAPAAEPGSSGRATELRPAAPGVASVSLGNSHTF